MIFVVARDFAEPMGQEGDTALSMCVMAALELLDISRNLPDGGSARLFERSRKDVGFA